MTRVVVVGSINVDLVARVEKLPGPGETVIGATFVQTNGGKGANQAVAAARAGADVVLVGMLGDDDLGRQARAALDAEGVDTSHVGTGSAHTGVALILVDSEGENLIAVASGANDDVGSDAVSTAFDAIGEEAVVLSVLEIPDAAVVAAAKQASQRGWPFVLNPAPARTIAPELLSMCTVLTPNEHEAPSLGAATTAELLDRGVGAVVVTMGAKGAEIHRAGQEPEHVAAARVTPVDTTGAGDAFSGVLAAALAEGHDLRTAVAWANAAAGLSTVKVGAREGMPSRDAIEKVVSS
jgi:ribokinase